MTRPARPGRPVRDDRRPQAAATRLATTILALLAVALPAFLPSAALARTHWTEGRPGIVRVADADGPSAVLGERRVQLPLRHQRQEPQLCVPTSVSMVLDFYGETRPPRELKTLAGGGTYDPARPFTDFTPTWFRDMAAGMRRIGHAWTVAPFANDAEGFRAGLDAIRASLRQGRPVLVDVAVHQGHAVVVAGFDDARSTLDLVDPSAAGPGRYRVGYAEFERLWNSRPSGWNGRGALFTRPRPGAVAATGPR